jgi:hypothetical protein
MKPTPTISKTNIKHIHYTTLNLSQVSTSALAVRMEGILTRIFGRGRRLALLLGVR